MFRHKPRHGHQPPLPLRADAHDILPGRPARARQLEAHEVQVETERARNLSECLPAELDPGGHCGPISDGAQLSARLTTNVFAAGQPITLSLILRNTTTNRIALLGAGLSMFDPSSSVRTAAADANEHRNASPGFYGGRDCAATGTTK